MLPVTSVSAKNSGDIMALYIYLYRKRVIEMTIEGLSSIWFGMALVWLTTWPGYKAKTRAL